MTLDKRWEYKIEIVGHIDQLHEVLNEAASDGWRFKQVVQMDIEVTSASERLKFGEEFAAIAASDVIFVILEREC